MEELGKNGVKVNTALTCRSTHLSRIRLLFSSQSSPEEVMQKVEPDVEPRPQATSQKKLFLSSPSSPDRPSNGTGALAWKMGLAPLRWGWDRFYSVWLPPPKMWSST